MSAAEVTITGQPDTPEALRYNRIRRWLGIADFASGFALLIVLLLTQWTGSLRDLTYRAGFQNLGCAATMLLGFPAESSIWMKKSAVSPLVMPVTFG